MNKVYLGTGYKGDYSEGGFDYYKSQVAELYDTYYTINGEMHLSSVVDKNETASSIIYMYNDSSKFIVLK